MAENLQTKHTIDWEVDGMTCHNCALSVEQFLHKQGAEQVWVNFSEGKVSFETPDEAGLPAVRSGLEKLGFSVRQEAQDGASGRRWSSLEKRFYFSLLFTLPLIAHMFLDWPWLHHPWIQFGLALPVFTVGMYHFGRSGWASLRHGIPNMDVLIAMGAIAAFGYSFYGSLTQAGPDFLFYETAASIITLVLLGNLLEQRAVKKTTSAIEELARLQPQTAFRWLANGKSEEIPLEEVRIGDLLLIHEGEAVPTDGVAIEGEGLINTAMISGESLGEAIGPGSQLIGGTLLTTGTVKMQVQKVGQGTVLSQIIDMVRKAQADKPPIQELADKISAYFVPAVLIISLLTFLLSWGIFGVSLAQSIIHSVAVLVISCPCAMGLATPTAVMVGLGKASRHGILVKSGRSLEDIAHISHMVFDKTGTLTTGDFSIKLEGMPVGEEKRLRKVLLALEQQSSHPIAKALTHYLSNEIPQPMVKVKEHKGLGMSGLDLQGNQFQLGSAAWLAQEPEEAVYHVILRENGAFKLGLFLEDELWIGAKEAIAYLKKQGIKPIMLSGDRADKCQRVADALGISEVYAEHSPEMKLNKLKSISQEASKLAMVGDGINDAPALAQADVGISLGKATEVAIQSAQVVLLQSSMSSLIHLHQISQQTVVTIRQNLFWAFFYNVAAIPLAALGFLKPIIATMAMAFSDLMVIGNSLRLRWRRLRPFP
ncbi:MAG: cation-translocating P-type ATPase [Bacteroidota bacterium]